ncbi:hypothetical protein EDD11_004262 [Mortierella claussenii]|nr:hypothetical protein EDD11_004262 [Mortierella claussenii]
MCQVLTLPTLHDAQSWLSQNNPGTLVKMLLQDTGTGVKARRRPGLGKSYDIMIRIVSLRQMYNDVARIQETGFDLQTHSDHGCVMTDSICTGSFLWKVLASKMNELQAVKYTRLTPEILPSKTASTIGNTDCFLSEIRNVIRTQQDVAELWKCSASDIKILGVDLGQVYAKQGGAAPPKIYYNLATPPLDRVHEEHASATWSKGHR